MEDKPLEERLVGKKFSELSQKEIDEANTRGYVGVVTQRPSEESRAVLVQPEEWRIVGVYKTRENLYAGSIEGGADQERASIFFPPPAGTKYILQAGI